MDQEAVEQLAAEMARHPVEVTIKNWTDNPAKPPMIGRTTLATYLLDPAGSSLGPKSMQICDFEPKRARLVVQAIEAPISVHLAQPNTAPDAGGVAGLLAQPGRYIANTTAFEYCFYGPDAMWINSLGTLTRVTVTKEYYS